MKKLLLILVAVLCTAALSCVSSGGTKGGDDGLGTGSPVVGSWFSYNDQPDGGSSVINMTETEVDGLTAYKFTGNTTTQYEYGYVGWGIAPDEGVNALEGITTIKGVSFKILGDGKRYTIKIENTDVKDGGNPEYTFNTTAGTVETIEVPISFFIQPSWAQRVRLNQANTKQIQWQTHESWRPGSFEVTIWDVQFYH